MNDARAAGYGQSGSSRHGLTESRLYDDANRDLSRQQTGIGFGSFDKDLDRKLEIAQRADQFDMGRLQNTSQMLGGQNAAMQGGLNYGQNMQNLGMGTVCSVYGSNASCWPVHWNARRPNRSRIWRRFCLF